MKIDWPPERWGCPDWQDHESYPSNSDNFEDWQWKWEFLRRHKKYRDAYDPLVLAKTGFNFPKDTIPWKIMRQHGMDYLPDPTGDATETSNPFTLVGGTILPQTNRRLLQSKARQPMDVEEALELAGLYSTFETWEIMQSELSSLPLKVAVFDYSKQIQPQLDAVKQQLIEQQQLHFPDLDGFKNRRENWPRHLRVIDAKDQKATHQAVYRRFAKEDSDGDDDKLDEYYRPGRKPKAVVSQWHSQAVEVMRKAALLL